MTRYNYFYAATLSDSDKVSKKDILKKALKINPKSNFKSIFTRFRKKINKIIFLAVKIKTTF